MPLLLPLQRFICQLWSCQSGSKLLWHGRNVNHQIQQRKRARIQRVPEVNSHFLFKVTLDRKVLIYSCARGNHFLEKSEVTIVLEDDIHWVKNQIWFEKQVEVWSFQKSITTSNWSWSFFVLNILCKIHLDLGRMKSSHKFQKNCWTQRSLHLEASRLYTQLTCEVWDLWGLF